VSQPTDPSARESPLSLDCRDIENALRESAERLRLAIRAADLCLWDYDVATGRLEWTEECRALFGLTADGEVSQERFLAAVHPDDRERVARAIDRALREYAQYDIEFRIVRPDGVARWVSAFGDCTYDDFGRALRFSGVMIDINERKRAEAALRESEERFRQLAEAIDDVFWIFDTRAGRLVYVSPAYPRLYGGDSPASFSEPKGWLRSVHPEDRERVERAFEAHGDTDRFDLEYRVETSHGLRWVRDRGSGVRDPSGRVVRLVGVAQDITDRKLAEEALRAADRRKDEFLAMLAHELRNPLAPIRNAVELLRLVGGSGPEVPSVQALLERQVGHLTRLVDDLLDLARITQESPTIREEPVDAASAVERAIEIARPLIDARRQDLRVDLARMPMPLRGDPVRLAQIVSNLLVNAAYYTPEGGQITVTAEPKWHEAVIAVSDTGIGMDAAMLQAAFDPFVKGEPTAGGDHGGLGIGLALVKRLVELHGGTVAAASAGPGKGSRLTIRLPLSAVDPAPAASGATSAVAPSRRRRVLVVDDNRDSAESMMLLLCARGHDARACYTGEEALKLVPSLRPELVLLDIALPGLDGYEVARRLRTFEHGQRIVLAAMSGYGRDEDRERSREAEFDHHLVKPVDPSALERLLASL
jgi:PAS domain S-box-containing protein